MEISKMLIETEEVSNTVIKSDEKLNLASNQMSSPHLSNTEVSNDGAVKEIFDKMEDIKLNGNGNGNESMENSIVYNGMGVNGKSVEVPQEELAMVEEPELESISKPSATSAFEPASDLISEPISQLNTPPETRKQKVGKPRGPYKKRQPQSHSLPHPQPQSQLRHTHTPTDSSDDEAYCICRKPDDGRWMIGCDFCDDWFHGTCIDMNETKAKLVLKFACPGCREKGNLPIWKRKCRISNCFNPVSTKSKYCSKEHGLLFIQTQLNSVVGVSKAELSSLAKETSDIKMFRELGSELPEVSKEKLSSKIDNSIIKKINEQKSQVKSKLENIEYRKKYFKLVKERTKRVGEEMAQELGVKKRDTCGMDELFINDNYELFKEKSKLEYLEGREGMCLNEKRKCLKHNGWVTIINDEIILQEKQCIIKLERLDKEYYDLNYQTRISILESEL